MVMFKLYSEYSVTWPPTAGGERKHPCRRLPSSTRKLAAVVYRRLPSPTVAYRRLPSSNVVYGAPEGAGMIWRAAEAAEEQEMGAQGSAGDIRSDPE